jgi:hypothetical protein
MGANIHLNANNSRKNTFANGNASYFAKIILTFLHTKCLKRLKLNKLF